MIFGLLGHENLLFGLELAEVLHPSLDKELLLTFGRLVVNREMMVVLEPVKMLILVQATEFFALFSLLLLDTFKEATVRRVMSQMPLVLLQSCKVDIPWQIPLTFEVHALQRQSGVCVGHSHHA